MCEANSMEMRVNWRKLASPDVPFCFLDRTQYFSSENHGGARISFPISDRRRRRFRFTRRKRDTRLAEFHNCYITSYTIIHNYYIIIIIIIWYYYELWNNSNNYLCVIRDHASFPSAPQCNFGKENSRLLHAQKLQIDRTLRIDRLCREQKSD